MGNTLLKNYNIEKDHFLTGGFNNLWKIFKGTRKDRKQDVCIFYLEKKVLDKYPKEERDEIVNVLKKEAGALVKYKHPSILGIYEQLLEDKTTLIFVTEPIENSLASWIETSGASKLEIKLMMNELCKVISFLHDDAHVIHGSLNPDNIFISQSGHIKLSGLGFSLNDPSIGGMETVLNLSMSNTIPLLKFTAPEIVQDQKSNYCSDIFSVGTIIYNMLKFWAGETSERDIISMNGINTTDSYKRSIDLIESKLRKISFDSDDNDIIKSTVNRNLKDRPTIRELLDHVWFNDPKLKALTFIENLEHNDATKNTEFLSKFPNLLSLFEAKIIERRFLPSFMGALKFENLIAATLPAIFAICESPSVKIEFEVVVWPGLKQLFQMKQLPAAALYYILSKLNFVADKISNSEFATNMLNIICKALDCNVAKIQSVVLDNLSFIIKKIDSLAFKNQIYPRLVNIILSTTSIPLKVLILKSFSSVYSLLDQNILNESLLTNLEKVRKADNNSEICMAVVTIYEEIAKVVAIESIANKILPNLISILLSGNISKSNFENIMSLVQRYLTRIKESREKDLADDTYSKNETPTGNLISTSTSKTVNKEKDDFGFLNTFFGVSGNNRTSILDSTNTTMTSNRNVFNFESLNTKDSIAKEKNAPNMNFVINDVKKEKTLFDGLGSKNNFQTQTRTSQIVPPTQDNKIGFNFNENNTKQPQRNTLDGFNFNMDTNFKKTNDDFKSIDFTKSTNKNNGANILDSLLKDLDANQNIPVQNNNTGWNYEFNDDNNTNKQVNNMGFNFQQNNQGNTFGTNAFNNFNNKPDPFQNLNMNQNKKSNDPNKDILDNLLKF